MRLSYQTRAECVVFAVTFSLLPIPFRFGTFVSIYGCKPDCFFFVMTFLTLSSIILHSASLFHTAPMRLRFTSQRTAPATSILTSTPGYIDWLDSLYLLANMLLSCSGERLWYFKVYFLKNLWPLFTRNQKRIETFFFPLARNGKLDGWSHSP